MTDFDGGNMRDVQPGWSLLVERETIYQHHGHVPAGTFSRKVVHSIEWRKDYRGEDIAMVRLVGMMLPSYRKVHRGFRLDGDAHSGYELNSGDKPPLKYSVRDIAPPAGVKRNPGGGEAGESLRYVAGWLREAPDELAADLGIDLNGVVEEQIEYLGSGTRADAVIFTVPTNFPDAPALGGKLAVLKITNDRAQAVMSQAAFEDEPLGVVPVYMVVETNLPARWARRPWEPVGAETWAIVEKLVMPFVAMSDLTGELIAGETPDALVARFEAARAHDTRPRAESDLSRIRDRLTHAQADDPLIERWRQLYEAAIEWLKETCEAIGSDVALDLHTANWGVDPDSGDLVLIDLGQCWDPPPGDGEDIDAEREALGLSMNTKTDVKTYADLKGAAYCYACDAKAVSVRDRSHEYEGVVVPACERHADPTLRAVVVCALCAEKVPHGRQSVVIDGEVRHVRCHREACE